MNIRKHLGVKNFHHKQECLCCGSQILDVVQTFLSVRIIQDRFIQNLINHKSRFVLVLQTVLVNIIWAVLLVVSAVYEVSAQPYRFQGRLTPQQIKAEEGLQSRLLLARDTLRVEILDSLAWLYRGTDFERAMYYAQQAAREVESLGFPRVRAENKNYLGIVYRNLGNYPKAMACFVEARQIAEKYGYKTEEGYALNNIGDIYRYEGKYPEARAYVMQSRKRFQELRDTAGLHYCAIRLGEIARSIKEYPIALGHFQDALQYAIKFRNEVWQAGVLNRIGQIYHLQGLHNHALAAFHTALQISKGLPHDEDEQCSILVEIGKAYYSQHKYDSAIVVLERGLRLAETIGLKQQIREAAKMLASIYTDKKQFKEALSYRTQQMAVNDSLYTEIGRREIEKISAKYELEKQQDSINRLNESQRQERIIGIVLVVSILLLVIVALLLYRNSRAARRANAEIVRQQEILEQQSVEIETSNAALVEQNTELVALNNEKTELMNIVAHDLKNPIGAVHGLAELITGGLAQEEQLQETAQQIAAIAERMLHLVTNILDSNRLDSGSIRLQNVEFDILPIIEATCWQYRTIAEAKQVSIYYETQVNTAIVLADEQAVMQIADNLISNAVKYSPAGKTVRVRILRQENRPSSLAVGHESGDSGSTNVQVPHVPTINAQAITSDLSPRTYLRLEVHDEGEGISAEDMTKLFGKFARLSARPTAGEHSTGLGLSIVKKLVEAMNGRVWCESEVGKGAMFIVELPTVV